MKISGIDCGDKIICPYCEKEQSDEIRQNYTSYHGSENGSQVAQCEYCDKVFFIIEHVARNYEAFTQEINWANELDDRLYNNLIEKYYTDEWSEKTWEFKIKYHCSKYWNKDIIEIFEKENKLDKKEIQEMLELINEEIRKERILYEMCHEKFFNES